MKRVFVGGFAAFAALVMGTSAASAQVKIAYVNSQRLVAETPAAQQAQAALESDMTRYRAQIDSIEKAFDTQRQAFESTQSTLTAAVRTQRQNDLQTRYAAAQQQVQQIQQTAQSRQQQLVEPVMKRINDTIEAMRKEQNISIVLDSSTGAFLAADPSLDITEQVLARLRAAAPAAAAPATH
jgi:outer membrane protein